MHRQRLLLVVLVVLSFFAVSCFDIEQSLVLNKDLSGKAGFRMSIDFEPMVLTMLQMDREMSGKKGIPTKAEIDKAKADFLKKQKTETKSSPEADFETEKAKLNKQLPKGVKLLDADAKQEDMKLTTIFHFGFDNPAALSQIEFPKKDAKGGGDPTKSSVIDKPFSGLTVKDEGKTIVVRGTPVDPMEGVKQGAKSQTGGGESSTEKPDPQFEQIGNMIKGAMKGLRVAWKIEAPFKVLETNATRREGNTLIWEYTMDSLEKLEKQGGKIEPVYVKFAK